MFGRKCISALMEYQAMTNERDFVIEHIRERLRRLASQQDMLTCEHMLEGADEIERLELLAVNRLIEIDRLTALAQSNDDITWELTGENMRLKRWIYATARSLEKSSLSLEEYNAITAEVCHALEPKP